MTGATHCVPPNVVAKDKQDIRPPGCGRSAIRRYRKEDGQAPCSQGFKGRFHWALLAELDLNGNGLDSLGVPSSKSKVPNWKKARSHSHKCGGRTQDF